MQERGPVKYERMIWRIVPEETTRIATMMAGQADFCHWNPLQAIETFKKAPNLAVYEPTADFAMYYWGLKSKRENVCRTSACARRWPTWSTARRSTRRSSSARPRRRARWSIPRRSTSSRQRSTC